MLSPVCDSSCDEPERQRGRETIRKARYCGMTPLEKCMLGGRWGITYFISKQCHKKHERQARKRYVGGKRMEGKG
jgi:hypothetical protein